MAKISHLFSLFSLCSFLSGPLVGSEVFEVSGHYLYLRVATPPTPFTATSSQEALSLFPTAGNEAILPLGEIKKVDFGSYQEGFRLSGTFSGFPAPFGVRLSYGRLEATHSREFAIEDQGEGVLWILFGHPANGTAPQISPANLDRFLAPEGEQRARASGRMTLSWQEWGVRIETPQTACASLEFRAYTGIAGVVLDFHRRFYYEAGVTPATPFLDEEGEFAAQLSSQETLYGVGPLLGGELWLPLVEGVSLFGELSTSVLVGSLRSHFDQDSFFEEMESSDLAIHWKTPTYLATLPSFRARLGGEICRRGSTYSLGVQAGYEWTIYLEALPSDWFNGISVHSPESSPLSFAGFYVGGLIGY